MTSVHSRVDTAPVLSARSLTKVYDDHPVLDCVNFSIRPGEVKAILGASGSGKSTLLRVMALLEPADGGVLEIDGECVGHSREGERLKQFPERVLARQRRDIGMVFQKFNLFPHLTARRNVMLALGCVAGLHRQEAASRSEAMLASVGLGDRMDHFPSELSGGQQQRVAIARALVMRPKVLLFDEPTSALDPELVGEVLKVMEALAQSGTTMVLVTHEASFARKVSTSVSLMHGGKFVEEASPDVFFTQPEHEQTRRYIQHLHRP